MIRMAKKALAKKALAKEEVVERQPLKSEPAKKDIAKKEPAKEVPAKTMTAKKSTGSAEKVSAKGAGTSTEAESPAAKKVSPTLTTSEIGDHIAATFDIPKSHAKIYLTEAVALIGKSLKKGNKVRIAGLGVFQVKKRAARKGRNPNTGEPLKIKASKRVGFAVARDLKVKL